MSRSDLGWSRVFPVLGLLVSVGFLLCLIPSSASAEPRLQKGTHELAIHINPDFEGAIGDMTFIDVGYGYFFWDRFEVRATASYELLEDVAGNDSDYKSTQFDLIGEYNFPLGKILVPYVGVAIGWGKSEFASATESALIYGPNAGLKIFLADNVALDLGARYRIAGADVFINDFVAEDTDFSTTIGFRIYF